MEKEIVTISVITYNSSKTVIETLESIRQQTYPLLSLCISDDCSTDETFYLCREWLEKNEDRFVETSIIQPKHNTGISANGNRALDACKTRYHKSIAGDDLLKPECIETYMNYVTEHPEAVIVFSKVECFGPNEEKNKEFEEVFDYSFFNNTINDQLTILYEDKNRIPASTAFYNVEKMRELGLRNDERIPMMEDYPKWINFLQSGIKFHFINERLVNYRVGAGGISTTNGVDIFTRSIRLFDIYYRLDYLLSKNHDEAILWLAKREIDIMDAYKIQYDALLNSVTYRIGKMILRPFKFLFKQ